MRDLVREAAEAHTRLCMFYAVAEMLEGAMPGGCPQARKTASSIVRQCKRAAQVQLEKFDAASAALKALDAQGGNNG